MNYQLNTDYELARAAREINLEEQLPLPLGHPNTPDIWDCDWEETLCPVCGHNLDGHNAHSITRCANAR